MTCRKTNYIYRKHSESFFNCTYTPELPLKASVCVDLKNCCFDSSEADVTLATSETNDWIQRDKS